MTMAKEKKKFKLIPQVILLFAIGILATGLTTWLTQRSLSDSAIQEQIEVLAQEISQETAAAIQEYPAYDWLLSYWHSHADDLKIEYDVDFGSGTETEEKCHLLSRHYPGLQFKYARQEDLEAMEAEDQQLYAEITYSWLITRLNQIKRAHHIDYLFCVAADDTYQTQFFLLSAAESDAKRGTSYEEVYPLGNVVAVGADQEEAMRQAKANSSHLANAGDYMDYYTYLGEINGQPVFIGMTYDLSQIRASADLLSRQETLLAMIHHVFLSCICLLLIYCFVIRPLKKVQESIRLYKQDKDSKTISENLKHIKPRNEIGDLSNDVTQLAAEMDDYIGKIETITAEKERIGTELSLATQIQEGMLPNIYPAFPGRQEFDIFASMDPAREVGGDFYDFFLVDDDHLCIVMADVSGKGVPAALFMMACKIILQNNAMMGKSPAQILADTNAAICSNNKMEMFVTVWLGILEISTGIITAANAGHEYPAWQKTPDGPFELLKDKHSFVLGGMPGMKYKQYELQLTSGTKLFLYTDGVTEATDSDNHLFGTQRMLAALNEKIDLAPMQVLKNVRIHVDDFVKDAEQFDDLTMLCLEYKGKTSEITLEAVTENLPQVQEFIEKQLQACKCDTKTQMQISVAVEEIFVNIASYAYAPNIGIATIRMEIGDEVRITFVDQGIPYDPLAKQDPDTTLSSNKRELGGLGIFMTKKLMDDVKYEYRDGSNILTLTKNLSLK